MKILKYLALVLIAVAEPQAEDYQFTLVVEDEMTYHDPTRPRVSGAQVAVYDKETSLLVVNGMTDSSGQFVTRLTERRPHLVVITKNLESSIVGFEFRQVLLTEDRTQIVFLQRSESTLIEMLLALQSVGLEVNVLYTTMTLPTPVYLQGAVDFSLTDSDLDGVILPPSGLFPPFMCSDSIGLGDYTVRHVRFPFSFPCGNTWTAGMEGHAFTEFSSQSIVDKELEYLALNGQFPTRANLVVQIAANPGSPGFLSAGSTELQYLEAVIYIQPGPPTADPTDYQLGNAPSAGITYPPVPFAPPYMTPGPLGSNSVLLDLGDAIFAAQQGLIDHGWANGSIGVRFQFSAPDGVNSIAVAVGTNIENRPQLFFH